MVPARPPTRRDRTGPATLRPMEPPAAPPSIADAGPQTVTVLELEWWLPLAAVPAEPGGLLAALTAHAPALLPARYGPGSPPKWHVRDGIFDGFRAWWSDLAPQDGGVILAWECAAVPSHAVLISAAPPFEAGSIPAGRFKLTALEGALDAPAAAATLAAVGAALGAIHATASLLAGWSSWRGHVTPAPGAQAAGHPMGTQWLGLAPTLPALAWFGPAYAAEPDLAAWLASVPSRAADGGILAGSPDRLLTQAEATASLPPLPVALCARRREDLPPTAPPSLPAERIPAALARIA